MMRLAKSRPRPSLLIPADVGRIFFLVARWRLVCKTHQMPPLSRCDHNLKFLNFIVKYQRTHMPRQFAPLTGAAGMVVVSIFAILVMVAPTAKAAEFCSTCTKENKPVCGLDGQVRILMGNLYCWMQCNETNKNRFDLRDLHRRGLEVLPFRFRISL